MKMKVTAIVKLTLGLATVLLMGSCVGDSDSSGLEYMPDMYRSPAIEPYVDYGEVRGREQDSVKMKISALVPPSNTVPYFGSNKEEVMLMLPYARLANAAFKETHGLFGVRYAATDDYLNAAADMNPLKLTAENAEMIFKNGKNLYSSKCLHCHGEKGDGNGPMVASGAYAGVPDYKEASRAALSDGQIFYSIYYGKNMMGGHASMLDKKEIWTLVHYVRQFQNPDYGKFSADGTLAPIAAPTDTTSK